MANLCKADSCNACLSNFWHSICNTNRWHYCNCMLVPEMIWLADILNSLHLIPTHAMCTHNTWHKIVNSISCNVCLSNFWHSNCNTNRWHYCNCMLVPEMIWPADILNSLHLIPTHVMHTHNTWHKIVNSISCNAYLSKFWHSNCNTNRWHYCNCMLVPEMIWLADILNSLHLIPTHVMRTHNTAHKSEFCLFLFQL